MPNLEASFRALRVLHTAKDLFNQYGFHKVGIDRIIAESKVTKATFYNHFHSKERLIEMCLTFQKDGLKEEVFSIIHSYRELMVFDKLRKIFYLHANLEGLYRLPFKAIFEIEKFYPTAYKVVVDYRNWLVIQIHGLLLTVKPAALMEDAHMFLFVIDGAMVQLLSKEETDERDKLLDYFLRKLSEC
ncbi:TetR/AcrR family transcriptional regulator [Acinetobacter baumannii]|uniref:TetR/AcrR family transcriptional regulator n=1 Tax=Acinetobacter baumannii TaxID=470 RepID=UPI00044AE98C|nr:TetR/AcrR family transcriptional regulator [Acinetobacter baumannii]EXG91107.1 bacterial regulatory s, tetR family protein [Acinetobacter baumannii 1062314]MDC5435043.1 TetR/AcrR family transcriptional regulator [Acinetobacter baumannii]MDN8291726.1 helix-turn-helix domain-containing protein [Acinetobacter baumannii]TPS78798.1 TetR/AcrR family transcriptional regulator [Acinetobacter baumannii]